MQSHLWGHLNPNIVQMNILYAPVQQFFLTQTEFVQSLAMLENFVLPMVWMAREIKKGSQLKVREFENKWLWQAVFRKFIYSVQDGKGCTFS